MCKCSAFLCIWCWGPAWSLGFTEEQFKFETLSSRQSSSLRLWVQVLVCAGHLASTPRVYSRRQANFLNCKTNLTKLLGQHSCTALLVRLARLGTGHFLVGCSCCWSQQQQTCYHSCCTNLVQDPYKLKHLGSDYCFLYGKWNFNGFCKNLLQTQVKIIVLLNLSINYLSLSKTTA